MHVCFHLKTTTYGGKCGLGYYCPEGSYTPIPCTAGQYCGSVGLATPTGYCDGGYYCPQGSDSKQKIVCPAGHYCPKGSDLPIPCRNGTYNPRTRLQNETECISCDGGSYCNGTGLSSVSGPCGAGFYCPAGQTQPNPFSYRCPPGYYCTQGLADPRICPIGYYQDDYEQSSCKQCSAGYYCDSSNGTAISSLSGYECPMGYYCPTKTERSNQYPCPPGTYNNRTKLSTAYECQPCTPGYYCLNSGLSEPQGLCYGGFYCNGSTVQPNPSNGNCPLGNYCPVGSYEPTPCPEGTITPSVNSDESTDCQFCKPGNYCTPESSRNGYSLKCSAGYICVNGSSVPNPVDGVKGYICPLGHFCTEGAVVETACPVGSYGPQTGLAKCTECPAGTTCPRTGMNATEPCPSGYYCYNGTYNQGIPCPKGTYNPHTGMSSMSECLGCPSGSYCGTTGLSNVSGNCSSGYLCIENATKSTPSDSLNGPCPVGHYCIEGTSAAEKCPRGTLRNLTGGRSVDDCFPCTAGYYCDSEGMTGPTGECAERYYCSDTAKVNSSMPSIYLCPPGFYCPSGTADPIGCPPGTYQDSAGMTSCHECPSGFFCMGNTSNPQPCPVSHYCPNGTSDPISCPDGQYTQFTGKEAALDCDYCPAGRYCTGGNITGDCAAGFICYSGVNTPIPGNVTNTGNGSLCPYGFYCPAGTTVPQTCPPGKFIAVQGAPDITYCTECPGGRICPVNSTLSEPCWAGYYCLFSVGNPTPCPNGTYNNQTGASDSSWCKICPDGYVCYTNGIANYTLYPCPLGHFCPNGTLVAMPCPPGKYRDTQAAASEADCHLCPAGRYCPDFNMTYNGIDCHDGYYCNEGAQNETICPAGYYCPESAKKIACPPGFYCPEASTAPTICPPGHYCSGDGYDVCNCTDSGAIEPQKCPLGYREYDGSNRTTFAETCEPCKGGTYGASDDRSECTVCRAGVVCLDHATTDEPGQNDTSWGPNNTNSYLCPKGYYCPAGSSEPTACPVGRYNPSLEGTSLDSCFECPIDHFNHLTAQTGCFHCGGEASQSKTGQSTCTCNGDGRDFQESDRRCPCTAGFLENDDQKDCVKIVYDLCTTGQTRSQSGACYTDAQWVTYCRDQFCDNGTYLGFDRLMGICLCETDDLEELCDQECRNAQDNLITFTCASSPLEPYITVRDSSGTIIKQYPASSLLNIVNARNAITKDSCADLDGSEKSIRLMVMSETGFLGVYNPDSTAIMNIIDDNAKGNITGNITVDSQIVGRRRLLAYSVYNGTSFSGVKNPVICLKNGEYMFFTVTNTYYPIYDRNNLFNTNDNFDYGGFRTLAESMSLTASSATLFSYQFNEDGVYVFYLSTDENRKTYIRVMKPNTQCPEDGPFFPATTKYIVQTGISANQNILISPDWPVIFILLGVGLLAMVIMIIFLILFRKYGWTKNSYLFPFYRKVANLYNFDDYSSKGSTVYPVRKFHRNMHGQKVAASRNPEVAAIMENIGTQVENDDFWDYDKQVDLEAFNSKTLYDTLSKQSLSVTKVIGKQKEEVKELYQKISGETDSLKGLWAAKLNLKGKTALATDEDLMSFEKKLHALEEELERRKELGRQFRSILHKQLELKLEDEKCRESHQVNYQAALREAHRLLTEHTDKIQRNQLMRDGEFDHATHNAMERRISLLIEKMSGEVKSESERLGSWGILGQGTGARLVLPGGKNPATSQDLFGPDMSIKATNLIELDKSTGLIQAKSGAQMILEDGTVTKVPHDYFVHPQTGHVLPIQGNVALDPISSRLVFVVDSATGEASRSEDPFIPFVPYPTNASTGQLIKTKLQPLQHKSDLKYGAPMSDPETGLHVPILAVTLHPQTCATLPIGGTHVDPVTGLKTPIEVGSLMFDPSSNQPVPILAVTLDPESGEVVPVGGTKSGRHSKAPIIPGDTFTEPLSGKTVHVHGGYLKDATVTPSAGGYQALLDANVLACETRIHDAVRQYKEALAGCTEGPINIRHEEVNLEAAMKELSNAREKMKAYMLRTMQDIERRQERADILATTGGSPGMYEFSKTGQLLPILVGTMMFDPAGSGQSVPILGVERNRRSGNLVPLGGTMEDPDGGGLTPINIGKKAVDPVTGTLSPVIGVKMNPDNNMVVPITLASGAHRRKKPPPGATSLLEEEIAARRSFWRRQRQMEEEITLAEHRLSHDLLFNLDNVNTKSLERGLESVNMIANQLEEAGKREFQRRGAALQEYRNILPPEVTAVLTDGDEKEHEMEQGHIAAHVKYADTIRHFFSKLQQEEKKYKDKMADLDGAMNPDAENSTLQRYRQAKIRLQAELHDHVITRMEKLDEAHSALEYARERSELCTKEAKVVLSHSSLLAGDYDAQLVGVYGDADSSSDKDSELVPLLKQLIALLEAGGPFYLSTELLNLIQAAHGGQVFTSGQKGQGQDDKPQLKEDTSSFGSDRDIRRKKKLNDLGKTAVIVSAVKPTPTVRNGKESKTSIFGEAKKGSSWKDLLRKLFEKQAYEAAKLENDLKSNEINQINETLEEFEKKKQQMMDEAREDLQNKLEKIKTEKEKEKIMEEYATNLQKVNDAFEKQKLQQLENLRKKLLDERRQKKKDLHRKQIAEAQAQGVSPDQVPEIVIPPYDDLMKDLLRLQQEQEQALAEMQHAGEAARDKVVVHEIDPEFEQRIRAMDIDDAMKEELIQNARSQNRELMQQLEQIKQMLRNRKERHHTGARLTDEETQNLSAQEQKKLLDAREKQLEADRLHEEQALLEARRQMEKEQQRLAHEQAMRDRLKNMTEEQRDQIMAEFQNEMHRLTGRQEDVKQSQKDKVKAKLAARKRIREETEKEQAVAKELERITKSHVAKGDSNTADIIMEINNKVNTDKKSKEQGDLLAKQLTETEKLEEKHLEEMREMNRALDNEMSDEKQAVDTQIDQQLRLALATHQSKFDREMLLKRQQMTEEEYKQMLTDHKRELEALAKGLNNERDRQKRVITDKILERRKKRNAQREERQRVEMEEELTRQQQERDILNEKIARKIEDKELKKNAKDLVGDEAENLIYTVLRQRHLKEAIHLEDQLARELDAARRKARAEVEQGRQQEREKLQSAFDQEMIDLVANAGSMSNEELAQKKKDLKMKQKQMLKDFDDLTKALAEQAEKDIIPKVEVEQTHARLKLKEKQLQELADAMKTYSPSDELRKKYEEEARIAAEEAKRYKEQYLRQLQEELDRKKKEEREREEEKKRKLEEHYKQMEKALEEEHRKEEKRLREREAEKERLHLQQLEERRRHQEEEIMKANHSEDEKNKLLKEHRENMKKLDESTQEEQKRSRAALKAKLEARKKRRHDVEMALFEKQMQLDSDDRKREELRLKKEEEDLMGTKVSASVTSQNETFVSPPGQFSSFTPTGNMEQDWIAMLMASPLMKQINDLDEMLNKTDAIEPEARKVLGADYDTPYIDIKDAQWTCKGDLQPVDINQISPSQFVVYRFGVFITRLLHQSNGTPEVSLLLASNLPPNNYLKNAYRNSIFYEHARNVLFIKKERMDSIGEFIVIILHSLSHIKVGELTDDGNGLFLREFYKGLKTVCQDMFFSRTHNTPAAQGILGSPNNSRAALEQALVAAKKPDEKANVIGELVDMKVEGPTRLDFSPQKMSKRLYGYEQMASNARLRQYLAAKGGYMATTDYVSSRIAELKGSTSPTISPKTSPKRVPASVESPRDVFELQLADLQSKSDELNFELSELLKLESELHEGIAKMEKAAPFDENLKSSREKLTTLLMQKDDLLKRTASVETDIVRKEQELKSKKK